MNKDHSDPRKCQTKPRLGYAEFFEDAERRAAIGLTQVYCPLCQRYRWPDEVCEEGKQSLSETWQKAVGEIAE